MSCGSLGRGKKESDDYALTVFFAIPIFIGLPRGSRPAEEGGERD